MTTQESPKPSRPQINLSEKERMVSIGAGALAVLYALDSRPAAALMGFLAGGSLLYRGISGHCSVYEALGVPLDEATGIATRSKVE